MHLGQQAAKRSTHLEYSVLDGEARSVDLAAGEPWTFGRSPGCSETLALPALSRVSLVLQHVEPGLLRVVSRQSNHGRVLVRSEDEVEQHVIGLGSGPVHLAGGNYTLKVELPPVVLRLHAAVPLPVGDARSVPRPRGVSPAAERTGLSWEPRPSASAGPDWIAVTALAVTLARYPRLRQPGPGEPGAGATRTSETLRRAVALWCGHTSRYWVNERLKEAAEAADLDVKDGGDRVAAVVAHYAPMFPDVVLRGVRDDLLRLGLQEAG
ncbi:hypothetical protein G7072_00300 [Nocardioides sp. HDW12B]|uniref:hypothetical protein n=1 Tax=Nocardioides sp. HDW12B TaxID=2714939 RepID=UPI00140C4661|nr:hypothetical protein [Nocardioides sp. HDW12B]QIK64981.1 hypothetical protein G7072_00300 [Nocardioides sp. HDW12B]